MEIDSRLEPALKIAVAFRKKSVKDWIRKAKMLKQRLVVEIFTEELNDLQEIEQSWKR